LALKGGSERFKRIEVNFFDSDGGGESRFGRFSGEDCEVEFVGGDEFVKNRGAKCTGGLGWVRFEKR
jgi:hypothetical protein